MLQMILKPNVCWEVNKTSFQLFIIDEEEKVLKWNDIETILNFRYQSRQVRTEMSKMKRKKSKSFRAGNFKLICQSNDTEGVQGQGSISPACLRNAFIRADPKRAKLQSSCQCLFEI